MARPIPEVDLAAIEAAVAQHPGGASAAQIAESLAAPGARRTLQYRLRALVDAGRLRLAGDGRAARYHLSGDAIAELDAADIVPKSPEGKAVLAYVCQPVAARLPVGYDRSFLDGYRPNETYYLTRAHRDHLATIGKPQIEAAAAGTYAKQILNRLLIDLVARFS